MDVPTPNCFEPHPYYEEAYKESLKSREKIYNMTLEEVKKDIISKYNDNKGIVENIIKKYKERYCLFINERGVQTHIEDLCILSSSFQIE